jgi:hypothetical protein
MGKYSMVFYEEPSSARRALMPMLSSGSCAAPLTSEAVSGLSGSCLSASAV